MSPAHSRGWHRPEKSPAEEEIWTTRAGILGERDAAYEIDFEFANRKSYVVIHDLMLAGCIAVPPRPGRVRPAAMASCWPSRWSGTCWADERPQQVPAFGSASQ